MNLNDVPLIAMVERSLGWLSRNHEVIAQNIANADTPDYKARELAPLKFDRALEAVRAPLLLALTAPGHISLRAGGTGEGVRVDRDTYEVSNTGNSVSLEEQAVKISGNALQYQLATTLYGKSVAMLRAAIGNRG